jgi:hypothetical protein
MPDGREYLSDGLSFDLPQARVVGRDMPARFRDIIEAACQRPEIRPLAASVSFAIDQAMSVPFRVTDGFQVVLNPRSLATPPLSAIHIRHAAELALFQRRLAPDNGDFWCRVAMAMLVCRSAARYFGSLIFLEQELSKPHLPAWLLRGFELCGGGVPELAGLAHDDAGPDRAAVCELLALQGETVAQADEIWRTPVTNTAAMWVRELAPLAAPAEVVISNGGDTRSLLDPRTGLNAYGCCPRPRPWAVTFSSSTATSISDHAYQRVEQVRGDLIAAAGKGALQAAYDGLVDDVKERLAGLLGLRELGAEVFLTGSGTDAEFYALYLALRDPDRDVVNIIVAPDETGGGVVTAAAGRHFSATTPRGAAVEVGQPLAGFDMGRITVETVPVRDAQGGLLPPDDVDAAVARLAGEAVASGRRVLLHLVDSAKTGLGAPSLRCVIDLTERYRGDVDVVVDACQMRVGLGDLQAYLRRGWMILMTGSKFFTGPPFSGALVIPRAIAAGAADLPAPPAGLADYSSRADWPRSWIRQRGAMGNWANIGLLLRWEAALWEMRAFYSVAPEDRIRTLSRFTARIAAAIDACEAVERVPTDPIDRSALGEVSGTFAMQTVFTFMVMRPDGDGAPRAMSIEETTAVYHWLNVDISHQMPISASEAELALAARRFHIGQPVKLGSRGDTRIGGLRISAGARLVSGVAHDPALGPTPEVRLERETQDALAILDKITLIVKNADFLSSQILPPTTDISRLYMV